MQNSTIRTTIPFLRSQRLTLLAQFLALALVATVLTGRFKLSREDALAAQRVTFTQAHRNWVARLSGLLARRLITTEANVASHTGCALGQWCSGRGRSVCRQAPERAPAECMAA